MQCYCITFRDWTLWKMAMTWLFRIKHNEKMATRWLFAIEHYEKWLEFAWWVYNFQSKQNLLPVWCVALQFRRIHFANGWQWQTCYFFMVREKFQHRPELFEINVVTCNAIALLFRIEHNEKWLQGDFLQSNITKNG